MAALVAGVLSFECTECDADPELKKCRGCVETTQAPVWDDGQDEYFDCPKNYLTDGVLSWYESYRFADRFGPGIPYHQMPARWISALREYSIGEAYYQKIAATNRRIDAAFRNARGM